MGPRGSPFLPPSDRILGLEKQAFLSSFCGHAAGVRTLDGSFSGGSVLTHEGRMRRGGVVASYDRQCPVTSWTVETLAQPASGRFACCASRPGFSYRVGRPFLANGRVGIVG